MRMPVLSPAVRNILLLFPALSARGTVTLKALMGEMTAQSGEVYRLMTHSSRVILVTGSHSPFAGLRDAIAARE